MLVVVAAIVGGVTFLLLTTSAIALIRQLRTLAASLRRFESEMRPVLEEIQAASAQARDRSERLAARADDLRKGSATPGARLRG